MAFQCGPTKYSVVQRSFPFSSLRIDVDELLTNMQAAQSLKTVDQQGTLHMHMCVYVYVYVF